MHLPVEGQLDSLAAHAVDLVSRDELRHKLEAARAAGRQLRVKYGADPSAPDIHLGHVVGLNRLRAFQDLGHTVVFIIGDFTGRIGDPSGRSETRKPMAPEQVAANARTYQEQVFRVLDRMNRHEGITVIAVMHDVNLAALFCRRMLFLKEGWLAADGPVDSVLTSELLEKIYETPVMVQAISGTNKKQVVFLP